MKRVPSLQLENVLFGKPTAAVSAVICGETYWLAATDSDIIFLTSTSQLIRVLPFKNAFPSHDPSEPVTSLAYDAAEEKLAACSGNRVAVWMRTGQDWKVHSSFTASIPPTTLDIQQGVMVLGGLTGVSFWTCEEDSGIAIWTKRNQSRTSSPVSYVLFSHPFGYCALFCKGSNVVEIAQLSHDPFSFTLLSSIWHPEPVRSLFWRPGSKGQKAVIFTETTSGVLRIWSTMLDSPDQFCLWYTAQTDIFESRPPVLRSFWIGRLKRENQIHCDLCLVIYADGSYSLISIFDIDQTVPTCLSYRPFAFSSRFLPPQHLRHLQHSCILYNSTGSLGNVSLFGWADTSSQFLLLNLPISPSTHQNPVAELRWTAKARPAKVNFYNNNFFLTAEDGSNESWSLHPIKRIGCVPASTEFSDPSRLTLCLQPSLIFALTVHDGSDGQNKILIKSTKGVRHVLLERVNENQVIFLDEDGIVTIWDFTEKKVVTRERLTGSGKIVLATKDLGGRSQFTSLAIVWSTGELQIWNFRSKKSGASWSLQKFNRTDMLNITHITFAYPKLVTCITSSTTSVLTFWDIDESEFTSGLMGTIELEEPVGDISLCILGNFYHILTVTFQRRIDVYAQYRIDIYDPSYRWDTVATLSLTSVTDSDITSSAWINNEVLVLCGNQLYFFGMELLWAMNSERELPRALIDLVNTLELPLPEFHPQVLTSCVVSQQLGFIYHILATLDAHYDQINANPASWNNLNSVFRSCYLHPKEGPDYGLSLPSSDLIQSQIDLDGLAQRLTNQPLACLSENEREQLLVLVHGVGQVLESSRALDSCGRRYQVAMRSFFISKRLQSKLKAPSRLKYRDILWAFHSESQAILISSTVEACDHKLTWVNAKSLGIFMWLRSPENVREQMEAVARHSFIATDDRDPETATLFYLALRKKKVVQGLWKQTPGHSLQKLMVQFLMHNFDEERWKTAAIKNAYSLLGKRRYYLAAAFFLLADHVQDAVNVCLQQLDDFQLAVAIVRTYDADDSPILRSVIDRNILPFAFKHGYRWLASWSCWMINRRDLAVRVIVSPFSELVNELFDTPQDIEISDPIFEDPSLALLFLFLRDRSLQTVKGSKFITRAHESNFILHMCRSLRSLGCHYLAMDLAKNYTYLPVNARHPTTLPSISMHQRRQSTIRIDETLSHIIAEATSPIAQQAKKAVEAPPEFNFADFNF